MDVRSEPGASSPVETASARAERLRRLVEAVTYGPGHTMAIGVSVAAVAPGEVTLTLARRVDLLQPNGFFHGGVIAALADHAGGAAIATALPPERFAVTVDLQASFLAPARSHTLTAKASALRVGSGIGVARVDVFCGDAGREDRCAIATVTLRVVPMPQDLARRIFA